MYANVCIYVYIRIQNITPNTQYTCSRSRLHHTAVTDTTFIEFSEKIGHVTEHPELQAGGSRFRLNGSLVISRSHFRRVLADDPKNLLCWTLRKLRASSRM